MTTKRVTKDNSLKIDEDPDPRRWIMLLVLLAGAFLPPLDFFIVNIALPDISNRLHASNATTQLVISLYAAAYAVTLVPGGRLGDLFGRKRMFLTGLVGFGLASLLCGQANTSLVLLTGRLFQGVTAAVMAPQSLATIHAIFPSNEKSKALGFYGATFGFAAVAGQILSGFLVSINLFGLGWRTVFFFNLIIVIPAIIAAFLFLKESRSSHLQKLDIIGSILLALGLLAIIIPLTEGRQQGWPRWCIITLIMSAPLLFLFWHHEKTIEQRGIPPLVPPSIIHTALCRNLVATFLFYSIAPFFLIFGIYEQSVLGKTPLSAGLGILPLGIGFLIGPLINPCILTIVKTRTAALGMCMEVVGMLVISLLSNSHLPGLMAIPLFFIGLGQGIALPALVHLNVKHVNKQFSGLAAGLVNATLQMSAAISVAVIGGVFFWWMSGGTSFLLIQKAFTNTVIIIAILLFISALLTLKEKK